MGDPVTIGVLAAAALAMAAEAVVKAGVGEVVKDAYQALKTKIAVWCGSDVEALANDPTSKGRQLIVAEKIDQQSPEDQAEIKTLALALNEALRNAANMSPIGIDIGEIEAASVALKATNVREGTGIKIGETKTPGAFTATVSHVGESKR
jgi:hypothetical protein